MAKREYFVNRAHTHFVVVQDSYTLYIEYGIGLMSPGLYSARSFVCMLLNLLHIYSTELLQKHMAMIHDLSYVVLYYTRH